MQLSLLGASDDGATEEDLQQIPLREGSVGLTNEFL